MTTESLRSAVQQALAAIPQLSARAGVMALLGALGYRSERRLDLATTLPATFLEEFDPADKLNRDKAKIADWRSIEMVFQYSEEELRQTVQKALFSENHFDGQTYRSFLFLAVELKEISYGRSDLAAITRELNKLFSMPVTVAFRYGSQLTLAIVTHRPNKRDSERDVLERVALIHGIQLTAPHRAHIEILSDLALVELMAGRLIGGFDDLQRAWARTLDTSELNKRFYKEIADWYFWAVEQVTFSEGAGERRDTRNATSMIRLLTRLIFVWFLKEKRLVPDALFREAEVRRLLNSMKPNDSSYYKAILQNLFFATLNQEMNTPQKPENRKFRHDGQHYNVTNLYRYKGLLADPERLARLLEQVPFLNGGLFECLDKPDEQGAVVRIDGFSDRPDNPLRVPNQLFFSPPHEEDLNRVYGSRGRRYTVRGIIDILDRYKFTVTENTPIEQEVALDPELLGQVFENLLAAYNPETETTARKETGSFYTPRIVVDYMVDESLFLVFQEALTNNQPPAGAPNVEGRLRTLLAYSDAPHGLSPGECTKLVATIDRLKILDPACGSGAFPMGVLQKLVYVLRKLDPGNAGWKERQLERARQIPDNEAREASEKAIEDAFALNELDYGRKLYLIENCIYGVDIQPIAVQIAKLRCFIALVVEQSIDDTRPNRGVRSLPNLETKFVAANSLRGIARPPQMMLRDPEIERLEQELTTVRSRHFGARTQATKKKYRELDKRLRAQLATLLQRDGFNVKNARLLAQWDPYDQNASAPYFDPEWMFGLTAGFDVLIANPPYVRQEQIKEQKPALEANFPAIYSGTSDLYVYFFALGVQLLRTGGVLTYISSNKFYRSGYGQKLRTLLAYETTIQQIIDFGDAPVFTAIAYPTILVTRKRKPEPEWELLALNWHSGLDIGDFPELMTGARQAQRERTSTAPLVLQRTLTREGWQLQGRASQRLLEKLQRGGQPLGKFVRDRFYRGVVTGLNEAFVVDRVTRDALIAEHPSSAELLKPFLRGRDVKRWRVDSKDLWLIFTRRGTDIKIYPALERHLRQYKNELMPGISGGRKPGGYEWYEIQDNIAYWREFAEPKIVIPAITKDSSYAIDESRYLTNDKTSICISPQYKYIGGLLNSSTLTWFIRQIAATRQGGFYEFKPTYVTQAPIPVSPFSSDIQLLVDTILTLKKADSKSDITSYERKIDEYAYTIFGLQPDEIRMIEEQS